jgi:hypothetical protein
VWGWRIDSSREMMRLGSVSSLGFGGLLMATAVATVAPWLAEAYSIACDSAFRFTFRVT